LMRPLALLAKVARGFHWSWFGAADAALPMNRPA
jgi:hypothetical protein